jgi:hypothetical protein
MVSINQPVENAPLLPPFDSGGVAVGVAVGGKVIVEFSVGNEVTLRIALELLSVPSLIRVACVESKLERNLA